MSIEPTTQSWALARHRKHAPPGADWAVDGYLRVGGIPRTAYCYFRWSAWLMCRLWLTLAMADYCNLTRVSTGESWPVWVMRE